MPPSLAGGSLPLFRLQQSYHWGLPGSSAVKNPPANVGDLGLILWVGKVSWTRKWQPLPVFLPGKSHGQKGLVGYSPWACQELDATWELNNKNNNQIIIYL